MRMPAVSSAAANPTNITLEMGAGDEGGGLELGVMAVWVGRTTR